MDLKTHIEKAVKEFVYPVTPPTQEDIEFVVTPVLEAINDWLNEKHDVDFSKYVEEYRWGWEDCMKRLQTEVNDGTTVVPKPSTEAKE